MTSMELAQWLFAPDHDFGVYAAAQLALREYAARTYTENCAEDIAHWQTVKMVIAAVPEVRAALLIGSVTILEIADEAKALILGQHRGITDGE